MILFSPAKINIGLQILNRREDGYHNLQSVMQTVGLCDIVELRRSFEGKEMLSFSQSGIPIDSPVEKNLCIQACELFNHEVPLPPLELHLHKQIPVGAGLGGGSSNATTTLIGLNRLTGNLLKEDKLHELAARLGSDCPFFLHEKPMLLEGRGDILGEVSLGMDGLYLVLIFPELHISTAEAYAGITPGVPARQLRELVKEPVHLWREHILNDFESSVFERYPELVQLKSGLYQAGAVYASLSGSGSSMYGLFPAPPELPDSLEKYTIWKENYINSRSS